MNTRTAAPVIITVSLVVLMSGCASAAAQGGQVRDDLSPLANAAAVGIARGHVIAPEELSPNRVADRIERAIEQAAQSDATRSFSADARRELHSQPVTVEQGFSADARRELHSQPVAVDQTAFSADAIRELKGSAPVGVSAADMQGARLSEYAEAQAAADVTPAEMQGARLSEYAEAQAAADVTPAETQRSAAAVRELKGSAPTEPVDDVLSPLRGDDSDTEPQGDPVDDFLSPLGGAN